MDFLTLLWGSILVLLGSFLGGFVASMVVQGYGYAQLDQKIENVRNKLYSGGGVVARQEKAERLQGAMAEAVLIMKDEGIPKEEKTKHLLALAGKYPDVAFDLVKKVGLNGIL